MSRPDSSTRIGSASSHPPEAGGYAPGTILADRYRIVALLGRGGMGEVYRADDLKLGQAVALKFLPVDVERDADARARLLAETRNSRTIAHPNVCRVYDAGEVEGRPFLTMEYIDGEDLASLLRRIGRLPSAKAVEIARQLCAGLAAAHERGVLHRDLKPANVMIDGRGQARITDFGLAVEKHGGAEAGDFAGTVAYMAPERLHGAAATVQSDIYALGLVLYEVCTGRPAFRADTFEAWREAHDSSTPEPPTESSGDVDPALERVILRCLEKAPSRRPSSAAVVAASLPGGDPLAAAMAAGETPSPELVAASGEEGTLPRRTAWGLLAALAFSVGLAAAGWQWTSLANLVPFEGSGDVLQARSRAILRDLGYAEPAHDSAWWILPDAAQQRLLAARPSTAQRFADAGRVTPLPLSFRYRQSPADLRPLSLEGTVTASDPAPEVRHDARVHLDSLGRLTLLRVVPPAREPAPGAAPELDWGPLLKAAGLDAAALVDAAPIWVPPVAFDARRAWTGRLNGESVRFEAAAYRGQVVFGAWGDDRADIQAANGRGAALARPVSVVIAGLWIAMIAAVALLARHNLRTGRGDRRGARRVALVVLMVAVASDALSRHWVPDIAWVWDVISGRWGRNLFDAAIVWLSYLGLEPFARRVWPQLLVGWARMLDGRWDDPLVGRGMLSGAIVGALLAAVGVLPETCGRLFNLAGTQPFFALASLAPADRYAANLIATLRTGITFGLGLVALMVTTRFALRSNRSVLAAAALVAALFAISAVEPRWLDLAQALIIGVSLVAFLDRYGLLGTVVAISVNFLIRLTPWTFDPTKWFAWRPVLSLILIMGLACWGFRNVLGRQSAFPKLQLD